MEKIMSEVKEQVRALCLSYLSYLMASRQIKELELKIRANEKPQKKSFEPERLEDLYISSEIWSVCFLGIIFGFIVGFIFRMVGSLFSGEWIGWTVVWVTITVTSFIQMCVSSSRVSSLKEKNAKTEISNQKREEEAEIYNQTIYPQRLKEWENTVTQIQYKISELQKEEAKHLADIESNTVLPPRYKNVDYDFYSEHPIFAINDYLENGRADSIKEAINLYENEEREARRDYADNAHRAAMQAEAREARIAQERTARAAEREAMAAEARAVAASQANDRMIKAQEDANKIAKRRASAEEDAAANSKKSAEELETIRRIHTGERGV